MNSMKYILFSLLVFSLLGGLFATIHNSEVTTVTYKRDTPSATTEVVTQIAEPEEAVEEPVVSTSNQVKEIEIQPGDTFSTIMEEVAVTAEDQSSILAAVQDVYDFTKLQAGKLIHVVFAQDALASVDYDLNDDKKIVIENVDGEFVAKEEAIEYDVTEVVRSATIESSLFYDGASAGLSDKTLVELAEIFQWDIDFSTDIQIDDSFVVLYEERKTKDGEEASAGKILAAQFTNQGETYEAYYFETSTSTGGYYAANGESVERQFLSSPIGVGYVSSGFSYSRLNPITKRVTPHRAIDYAAPHGTPIVAIADGEVTLSGNRGPLGIAIDIEHGQYMSQYAHMSSIDSAVKKNPEVKQGQVIGYVGSTGQSTGPHLHYTLFKDGNPINPADIDMPVGELLTETELDDFQVVADGYKIQLGVN
tara:strand:+ start:53973 stop:55235 length:1263 start_codon:yes stop_codon:yes gene_type:complete